MKSPKSTILIEDQPEATCEACGRLAELRPYGKKREDGGRLSVCFECAMENEAEAKRAFAERLGGENSVGRDFTLGEAMRTVETRCTACGRDISGVTQIRDHDEAVAIRPEEGSVAVCQYCGHVMVMEEGGALRNPTSEEMADIAGDPRITAFNDVRVELLEAVAEAKKQPNPKTGPICQPGLKGARALLKSLPPSPRRIKRLPLDGRGYPVPYFVEWVKDGRPAPAGSEGAEPDFRLISEQKRVHCFRRGICWTCGEPLGVHRVYPIGPMCAVNRTTMEPASHRDCAEYAVKACPFLVRPRMRRLPKDDMGELHVAGVMIERNPGVTCLWETHDARAFDAGDGWHDWLIRLGEPDGVDWWREGRKATRDEVIEAIESGMPALAEIAFDQGADAMAELDRMARDISRFLPPDEAVPPMSGMDAVVLRAVEEAEGFKCVAPGEVDWLRKDDWDGTIVSTKGDEVRIVVVVARKPGSGAFSRLIDGIAKAGLRPIVVEPIFEQMPLILKRWGWREQKVGHDFNTFQTLWRPSAQWLKERGQRP